MCANQAFRYQTSKHRHLAQPPSENRLPAPERDSLSKCRPEKRCAPMQRGSFEVRHVARRTRCAHLLQEACDSERAGAECEIETPRLVFGWAPITKTKARSNVNRRNQHSFRRLAAFIRQLSSCTFTVAVEWVAQCRIPIVQR